MKQYTCHFVCHLPPKYNQATTPAFIMLRQVSLLLALCYHQITAFTAIPLTTTTTRHNVVAVASFRSTSALAAGGFEWEDPGETFDQGVDNPFKNPSLMQGSGDEAGMKIDPARLLGPRLGGSNLYFIGMMGCGKSAVGDRVARRE